MLELVNDLKEIQYMERKPKKLGLLIWMLTIVLGYTNLPYCFAFELLKYSHTVALFQLTS